MGIYRKVTLATCDRQVCPIPTHVPFQRPIYLASLCTAANCTMKCLQACGPKRANNCPRGLGVTPWGRPNDIHSLARNARNADPTTSVSRAVLTMVPDSTKGTSTAYSIQKVPYASPVEDLLLIRRGIFRSRFLLRIFCAFRDLCHRNLLATCKPLRRLFAMTFKSLCASLLRSTIVVVIPQQPHSRNKSDLIPTKPAQSTQMPLQNTPPEANCSPTSTLSVTRWRCLQSWNSEEQTPQPSAKG
eukprot:5934027-Amphidinium_carterae.1